MTTRTQKTQKTQEQEPIDPILDDTIATIEEPAPEPVSEPGPEPPTGESTPSPAVHFLTAAFPMLEGDELLALAEDICDNGLRQPVVLDRDGQVIDGRNRLKACELAGVTPTFVTTDLDPIAYILSVNVHSRHLSKGQQAMAYAMAYPVAIDRAQRQNRRIEYGGFAWHHEGSLCPPPRFDLAKVMAGSLSCQRRMPRRRTESAGRI